MGSERVCGGCEIVVIADESVWGERKRLNMLGEMVIVLIVLGERAGAKGGCSRRESVMRECECG